MNPGRRPLNTFVSEDTPLLESSSPRRGSIPWKTSTNLKIGAFVSLCALMVYAIPRLFLSNSQLASKLSMEDETLQSVGHDPFASSHVCDSEHVSTISYHIHVIFDGKNERTSRNALTKREEFIQEFNPNMKQCPMSHSNPSQEMTEICHFPLNYDVGDYPLTIAGVWQGTNYAFFIPTQKLDKVETWWENRHTDSEDYAYVIHPLTGCQRNDHSKWLHSYSTNFNADVLVLDYLVCCQNGPVSCTCDIVMYEIPETSSCLTIAPVPPTSANNLFLDFQFVVAPCEDMAHFKFGFGSWREITYDADKGWYQIENYGGFPFFSPVPSFFCLGVDVPKHGELCTEGNEVTLVDCAENQHISKGEWVAENTRIAFDEEKQKLRLTSCEEPLCLQLEMSDDIPVFVDKIVVTKCEDATVLKRIGSDFPPNLVKVEVNDFM